MSLIDTLKERIQTQLAAYDEQLEAAQAQAKARRAKAESDEAAAKLDEEVLIKVNELKDRIAEGNAQLQELAQAGEEKAGEIRDRLASFFDK